MGNKSSVLSGGRPQNVLSGSRDSSQASCATKTTDPNSARPVALSAEEQAVADAEAKRYSELFGGKPKAPKAPGGGRRSAQNAAAAAAASASPSSKNKKTATPQKKKQRQSPSPAAAESAVGNKKGKGVAPVTDSQQQQQQQRLVQAVSAKILDLEKDKAKDSNLAELEENKAIVPATAAASEVARSRAAVASALLAGAKPDNNIFAGGVPAGTAGGMAAVPCRSISPRPAPPRNFKAKV
eukprot:g12092.t1